VQETAPLRRPRSLSGGVANLHASEREPAEDQAGLAQLLGAVQETAGRIKDTLFLSAGAMDSIGKAFEPPAPPPSSWTSEAQFAAWSPRLHKQAQNNSTKRQLPSPVPLRAPPRACPRCPPDATNTAHALRAPLSDDGPVSSGSFRSARAPRTASPMRPCAPARAGARCLRRLRTSTGWCSLRRPQPTTWTS
jgi:hypothetical protein